MWLGCSLCVHGRAWYPLFPFKCPRSFQYLNGSHIMYWHIIILNPSRFKVEPHSKYRCFSNERNLLRYLENAVLFHIELVCRNRPPYRGDSLSMSPVVWSSLYLNVETYQLSDLDRKNKEKVAPKSNKQFQCESAFWSRENKLSFLAPIRFNEDEYLPNILPFATNKKIKQLKRSVSLSYVTYELTYAKCASV